ncbi:MAG: hypothetical protein ACLGPL_09875 [Acidobacteriota bacterium]
MTSPASLPLSNNDLIKTTCEALVRALYLFMLSVFLLCSSTGTAFGVASKLELVWPKSSYVLVRPTAVAVDPAGNVYVVDTDDNRVNKFDANGKLLAQWGVYGTGNGQFDSPSGVAVDETGTNVIVDSGNGRIQKFTTGGVVLAKWGSYGTANGLFRYPTGVAVDLSGNVYVCDTGNDRIQKFSPEGVFSRKWGATGVADGQFHSPMDIALDLSYNIYITDNGNNRVRLWSVLVISDSKKPDFMELI